MSSSPTSTTTAHSPISTIPFNADLTLDHTSLNNIEHEFSFHAQILKFNPDPFEEITKQLFLSSSSSSPQQQEQEKQQQQDETTSSTANNTTDETTSSKTKATAALATSPNSFSMQQSSPSSPGNNNNSNNIRFHSAVKSVLNNRSSRGPLTSEEFSDKVRTRLLSLMMDDVSGTRIWDHVRTSCQRSRNKVDAVGFLIEHREKVYEASSSDDDEEDEEEEDEQEKTATTTNSNNNNKSKKYIPRSERPFTKSDPRIIGGAILLLVDSSNEYCRKVLSSKNTSSSHPNSSSKPSSPVTTTQDASSSSPFSSFDSKIALVTPENHLTRLWIPWIDLVSYRNNEFDRPILATRFFRNIFCIVSSLRDKAAFGKYLTGIDMRIPFSALLKKGSEGFGFRASQWISSTLSVDFKAAAAVGNRSGSSTTRKKKGKESGKIRSREETTAEEAAIKEKEEEK